MLRRRHAGILAAVGLLVAGCADNAPQDTLDPAGPSARTIDNLFTPVLWIAVAVFVLVQGLIVGFIIKYRQKKGDEESLPGQIHGNTRLEVSWTILPAVVLAGVAVFTVPVIFELNEKPDSGIEVAVEGQQFWWSYRYDAAAGATVRPFETANELHIPAGEPVYLTLTSNDVIHSFWAPRLNGKRDVVPGRVHHWTLEADEPGVYAGQCAEFCGTSHANMRLKVVAHDRTGYDDWLTDQQREGTEPAEIVEARQAPTTTTTTATATDGAAAEEDSPDGDPATGFALFEQKGCAGCHQVDGVWEEVAADSPAAPNLTHLFDRDCFAGCIYNLDDRNEMEAWLRDPQRKAGSLMVIGQLTEAEIDDLYAYLRTLD